MQEEPQGQMLTLLLLLLQLGARGVALGVVVPKIGISIGAPLPRGDPGVVVGSVGVSIGTPLPLGAPGVAIMAANFL